MYVPQPGEVVSPPANPQPARPPVGNMGPQYGIQASKTWAPNDGKRKQLCDAVRPDALWRLSVFGAVYVSILYGSSKAREIALLQAPVVITIPGQFEAYAEPIDVAAGAMALVALTQATAGALSQARKFVSRVGADVTLDVGAVRFFALAASTLTISGLVVNVPALQAVPIVVGSVLTNGSGFQEFEA